MLITNKKFSSLVKSGGNSILLAQVYKNRRKKNYNKHIDSQIVVELIIKQRE